MKDNDRIDLQIEAESIPTDSKRTKGKTRKRRRWQLKHWALPQKPKMVKPTLFY